MGTKNHPTPQSGQIVIELVVCALVIVVLFLISITLSDVVLREQKKNRFPEAKGMKWTPRP